MWGGGYEAAGCRTAAHVSWLQGKLGRQEASEIMKGMNRGPTPLPHPNTDSRALGSPLCLAEGKVLLVVFKGWVSCCMHFESKIGVPVIPGLGGMGQVEAAHFTGQGGDPAVEGHFSCRGEAGCRSRSPLAP